MRKFVRLVFIGLFLFLGYKYLESKDIKVKEWIAECREWVEFAIEEFQDSTSSEEEAANGTVQQPLEDSVEITSIKSSTISNPVSSGQPAQSISENRKQARLQTSQTRTSPGGSGLMQAEEEISVNILGDESYKTLDGNLPNDSFEWIKAVTEQYSPNSWYMLMRYEHLPARAKAALVGGGTVSSNKPVGTFHYLEGSSKLDLLSSMETNVHELAHGYFRQNTYRYARENEILLDWDKAEGYVYISPSEAYFVSFPVKSLFPSRELASVIPNHLRTFRFDTYIEGTSSTQSEGIIGLLNELHAYYLGSKYNLGMLDVYQNVLKSDASGLLEWITNAMSSMNAFYEFDFFIKEYLLYMKNNYPAEYSELKSTPSFKQAYSAVFNAYENLTRDYRKLIQVEMQQLNSSGIAEVSIKENLLWVRPVNSNTSKGALIFSEDRKKLAAVLESDRYLEIVKDFLR